MLLTLATVLLVVVLLATLIGLYIRQRWRTWMDRALDATFESTDLDKSGKINRDEFYIAVLEMYIQFHLYGVNVRAPNRETIMHMMEEMDADDSGDIDRQEFRRVITRLLMTQSTRMATQLALTVVCPVTAGYVTAAIRLAASRTAVAFGLSLATPPALASLLDGLPESLDQTLVCGAMLGSIGPALAAVDYLFETKLTPSKAKDS